MFTGAGAGEGDEAKADAPPSTNDASPTPADDSEEITPEETTNEGMTTEETITTEAAPTTEAAKEAVRGADTITPGGEVAVGDKSYNADD